MRLLCALFLVVATQVLAPDDSRADPVPYPDVETSGEGQKVEATGTTTVTPSTTGSGAGKGIGGKAGGTTGPTTGASDVKAEGKGASNAGRPGVGN